MTSRTKALKFIVLLGMVSLFADFTYEGARAITGPFLSILGASGTAVGIIVGLGALIGYGVRGVSGYLSDKTRKYWLLTIVGYCINLLAVPLLALANSWLVAAFLIVLERFGKAIRVPARDAMLSYATKHTGRGWGFGIHEGLDQIGAVVGPLSVAGLLFFKESYQLAFLSLAIPAIISLSFLGFARFIFPKPQEMEPQAPLLQTKGFSSRYWIYLFGVGLVALGFVDFPLIAYHLQKTSKMSAEWIPFLYGIAMGVDGLAALIMGKIFDVKGIALLALVTLIAAFFAPLVFLGNNTAIFIGMLLWGIGMGAQESIMRAIVATLVPPNKRGSGYGLLNMFFGLFWGIGSAIIGYFYDISLVYLVLFSLITQLLSIPLFIVVHLKKRN